MSFVQVERGKPVTTENEDMQEATKIEKKQELDDFQEQLEAAKKSSSDRTKKADDLTTRFRELRRKNHFRIMLEEVFNE